MSTATSTAALCITSKARTTQAIADLNKAIALNPVDADAFYNLGLIYFQQGRWAQAIFNFNKDLEINSEDADAYDKRAISYAQLKNTIKRGMIE